MSLVSFIILSIYIRLGYCKWHPNSHAWTRRNRFGKSSPAEAPVISHIEPGLVKVPLANQAQWKLLSFFAAFFLLLHAHLFFVSSWDYAFIVYSQGVVFLSHCLRIRSTFETSTLFFQTRQTLIRLRSFYSAQLSLMMYSK
jgi:hypothetical protein